MELMSVELMNVELMNVKWVPLELVPLELVCLVNTTELMNVESLKLMNVELVNKIPWDPLQVSLMEFVKGDSLGLNLKLVNGLLLNIELVNVEVMALELVRSFVNVLKVVSQNENENENENANENGNLEKYPLEIEMNDLGKGILKKKKGKGIGKRVVPFHQSELPVSSLVSSRENPRKFFESELHKRRVLPKS